LLRLLLLLKFMTQISLVSTSNVSGFTFNLWNSHTIKSELKMKRQQKQD